MAITQVTLASGGLDSSVVCLLARDAGIEQEIIFVDYGQLAAAQEWQALTRLCEEFDLPTATRVDVREYGSLVESGLVDQKHDIVGDAVVPFRNALLLLVGAARAVQLGARSLAIGLLAEPTTGFLDQSAPFVLAISACLKESHARSPEIVLPLRSWSKTDIIKTTRQYGIRGAYSCHAGEAEPCRECIGCQEVDQALNELEE